MQAGDVKIFAIKLVLLFEKYHIDITDLHIWEVISNTKISQVVLCNSPLIEGIFSFSQEKQVLLIVKMFDGCKL